MLANFTLFMVDYITFSFYKVSQTNPSTIKTTAIFKPSMANKLHIVHKCIASLALKESSNRCNLFSRKTPGNHNLLSNSCNNIRSPITCFVVKTQCYVKIRI